MWRRTGASEADRAAARVARIVTLAATLIFLLVVTRWRPWDLFGRAGYSADFYDEQARSFLRLRLAVRPEVATIEGFLIDGKTYLYYGPFLAFARLPFAVFGDVFAGRLAAVSMVAAFVALCTATFHLGRLALDWWTVQRPDCDANHDGVRLGVLVAAVAASPAMFLTGWISVYHETELWAAAFAVWAAVGAVRFSAEPTRRHAALTAAPVVAAMLTRATVGIGIGLGVCLVAVMAWRHARRPVAGVLAAAALGVGVHVAFNVARFGTLLSLPAERQLLSIGNPVRAAWFAGNDGSFFGLRFLPTTIVHYFRPDTLRFERLLPIIRFGPPASDLGSYPVESNTPAASLTATATVLFVGALIGLVVLVRRRAWVWLALFVGGAIASAPSFAIGFIANRYLVDMLPMLIVAAAVAAAAVPVPSAAARRRALAGGLGVLLGFGLWANVALATWTQNVKDPGFVSWRYQVDDVIFGDPPPGLVDLRPGDPAPRDGIVGIDPECAGVYVAEQGKWIVLERAAGVRELVGTVRLGGGAPGDETVLATGQDWVVTMVRGEGDAVRARLEVDGVPQLDGSLVPYREGAEVRLVLDPVIPEVSVTVDGRAAMFGFDPPTGPPAPSSAFDVRARGTEVVGDGGPDNGPGDIGESLCRRLQARR